MQNLSRIEMFSKCQYEYGCDTTGKPKTFSPQQKLSAAINQYIAWYMTEKKNNPEWENEDAVAKNTALAYSATIPESCREDFLMLAENAVSILKNSSFEDAVINQIFYFSPDWDEVGETAEAAFSIKYQYLEYRDISGIINIYEFSTRHRMIPSSEFQNSFKHQAMAFCASRLFPDAKLIYVRQLNLRYKMGVQMCLEPHSMPEIQGSIEAMLNIIKKTPHSQFKPYISSECSYCQFTQHCPKFQDALKNQNPDIITSSEQAQEAANMKRVLEIRLDQLDKALKNYVDANGPIETGDEVLRYVPVEKVYLTDPQMIFSELHDIGVSENSIWDNVSLSKSSLKSILKEKYKKEKLTEILNGFENRHGLKKFETHFKFVSAEAEMTKEIKKGA